MTVKKRTNGQNLNLNKVIVGWREWANLPELCIPAIKVKIDTGAKTSALHAFDVKVFHKLGKRYVCFNIHPLQNNNSISRRCTAEVAGERMIKSSNGQEESRYVIRSAIQIGSLRQNIYITLSNRDFMSYHMLLGREAMRLLIVDPAMSFCQGKLTKNDSLAIYNAVLKPKQKRENNTDMS
ncbi:MAG: Ribosomal protein S6 modification protein [Parcubacteria group bacterium GW2011_GWF2_38_8]|nr:MAG: Ribosomal protein S6 modification protein [Parcubacteria group bacterium GW2011_GWF2_38_8]